MFLFPGLQIEDEKQDKQRNITSRDALLAKEMEKSRKAESDLREIRRQAEEERRVHRVQLQVGFLDFSLIRHVEKGKKFCVRKYQLSFSLNEVPATSTYFPSYEFLDC